MRMPPRAVIRAKTQIKASQLAISKNNVLSTHYSTVVIWSGHIGSYEDQALLLGTYLRKDLVHEGTLG